MQKRIGYFDTAKGILILLMIIGHIWNDGLVHDLIYSFHMPAFFVISGLLFWQSAFLKKPVVVALLGKIRSLLIPYFFFEVFAILSHIAKNGMILNIKGYLFEMLSLHLFNGPLWFLVIMFLSEVLFLVLYKIFAGFDGKIQYLLIAILFMILMVLPKFQSYINISTMFMALFFLIIGYAISDWLYKQSAFITVMALGITMIISLVNNGIGMPDYQDGNRILFILGAITGSLFIIQISRMIQKFPVILLNFYGRNSLILLGTHYPIIVMIKNILNISEFSTAGKYACLMFIMLIEIPIIYIINVLVPFVIGKPYRRILKQAEK